MGKLMDNLPIAGTSFGFSATKIAEIGASEITLVTIAVDESTSVTSFRPELVKTLKTIVAACKKSPRAEYLMLRVIAFGSQLREVHGFKLLRDITGAEYDSLNPNGWTALYDAGFSAIAATATYAESLLEQDFLTNAIVYVITDGGENHSRNVRVAADIAQAKKRALTKLEMESFLSILVGVNIKDRDVQRELKQFETEADFDAFEEIENATEETMAKLAGFVSKSISQQSQALGTGQSGPLLTLH